MIYVDRDLSVIGVNWVSQKYETDETYPYANRASTGFEKQDMHKPGK